MWKSTERPLGPNLLSLPLSSPKKYIPTTSNSGTDHDAAPFVDLNDLKLLSDVREKERSTQKKFKIMFRRRKSRGFHRLPQPSVESDAVVPGVSKAGPDTGLGVRDDSSLASLPDSPIVIGIPASGARDGRGERQGINADAGAGADTDDEPTPGTPSIVITPAKEQFFGLNPSWGSDDHPLPHPRPTSSVYSQPTPRIGGEHEHEIPPVPTVPALYSTLGNDDTATSSIGGKEGGLLDRIPVDSTTTDDFPAANQQTELERTLRRLSINTDTNRRPSQGWWTYLLSPLSGRFDSTVTSPTSSPIRAEPPATVPPAPPSSFVTSSERLSEDWWDKEVSYFSPKTPKTEAAITSIGETPAYKKELKQRNDSFLTLDETANNHAESLSNRERTRTQPRSNGRQGAAAEYYQACTRDLYSGNSTTGISNLPSFEYANHVCSTTPTNKVVTVAGTQVTTTPTNTNKKSVDRGLNNYSVTDAPCSSNGSFRDLLVKEKSCLPQSHDGSRFDLPPTDTSRTVTSSTPVAKIKTTRDSLPPKDEPPGTLGSSDMGIHIRYPAFAHFPPRTTTPVEKHVPYYILIPSNQSEHLKAQLQPPNPTSPGLQRAMEKGGFIPLSNMQSTTIPILAPKPVKARESGPSHEKGLEENINDEWPRIPSRSTPISMMTTDIAGPATSTSSKMTPTQNGKAFCERSARFMPASMKNAEPSHSASEKGKRNEEYRRRHGEEDAAGKKIGGIWRGRGPFSSKGCFGRSGREGRANRRRYIAIALFLFLIIVIVISLATTLTRKRGKQTPTIQSRWLNLTGYPPMPTGIATIAGPEAQVQNSGCISPASMWSCALPKEGQSANSPYGANQPNFKVDIRFRNETHGSNGTSMTDSGSSKAARMAAKQRSIDDSFDPSPSPPSVDEQAFIGNTTDNNTKPYAGNETPFYISFLSPVEASSGSRRLAQRSADGSFPNLTSLFPPPDVNSDGTAAAANLYPLPSSQPVRLYNRGQSNEYYGFYTYFDRSIFLESSAPLNGSNKDDPSNDGNGGSHIESARTRCTWAQTRFFVQIWTQPGRSGMVLLNSNGSTGTNTVSTTSTTPTSTSTATASFSTASSLSDEFRRPGTFPYPITITLDRHGGTAKKKMVYCYGMNLNEHINQDEKKLQLEKRGFGGHLVNPAPGIFNHTSSATEDSSKSTWGGIDGGTGGCSCQWMNWVPA